MGKWIKSPKGRKYLYRVLLASIAVAVGYGLLADDTAALWVTMVGALIGLPLADANVDTSEHTEDDESI